MQVLKKNTNFFFSQKAASRRSEKLLKNSHLLLVLGDVLYQFTPNTVHTLYFSILLSVNALRAFMHSNY